MHILVLTADPKTLIYHRGELIREFARRGCRVTAAASGDDARVRRFIEELGGSYVPFRMARSGLNPLPDLLTIRDLWRIFRRVKPDVLFAYTIKSVIYGSLIATLQGVPRIFPLVPGLGYSFTPDGTLRQRFVSLASRCLYRLSLGRATTVFLQNHDDRKLLRERKIIPAHVPVHVTMGSGVRLDEFAFDDLEGNRKLRRGELDFVLVSRLLYSKGIREYAEAARRVRQHHPACTFHLVGPLDPGPDGVREKDIRRWEADGLLHYHGATDDVRPHLRRAHAFILPTYYREGIPRCLLEALAIGRPVITTDAVGSRETVVLNPTGTDRGESPRRNADGVTEGENGFLVRPRDSEALSRAVEIMLRSPDKIVAMGRRARAAAEERFDVRRINAGIVREMELSRPAAADPSVRISMIPHLPR